MNEGALSAAEVEALLAGVESRERARPSAQPASDFQSALDARITAWLPQARLMPSALTEVDASECQQFALNPDCAIVCERSLAASLVDFTYGGDGAVDVDRSGAWSVSERRMASRVLELAQAALRDVAGMVPPESCAFELRIGRGGGRIACVVESRKEACAATVEFTALLGYVRLSAALAAKLGAGDLIAFEPLASALLVREGHAYACQCGSHDNHYAVCIDRLLERPPEPPTADGDDDLVLAVELGHVVLPIEQDLAPGMALILDRPLDAPLRLLHGGACFAHVEIVELAEGFALHVLART